MRIVRYIYDGSLVALKYFCTITTFGIDQRIVFATQKLPLSFNVVLQLFDVDMRTKRNENNKLFYQINSIKKKKKEMTERKREIHPIKSFLVNCFFVVNDGCCSQNNG